MKLYKSLLFGLLVCGMAACDTTDLERDINSLKDRVEDYEAQVQKLNDDMNIIRVLLDGNKTITSYSFDGTNYTLTLSNGETLTLTQGIVGANYPSITIDEESGNWIIAGVDSGKKAEAKDGEDAPYTPQFKIENENWWVSYDGGVTWTDLGVKATGTASGTSPISSVTPATDGNSITITLSDGTPYTIPVVKDLVCEITEPELADGEVWYIGTGGATLKVRVNIQSGDIIRPIVPADWEAEVPDYSSLSGEQTLEVKVTPPSGASKCVVTMEVNRGANTVTDEIVARTEIANYWDEYQAGMDIVVGDPNGVHMVINKKDVSLTVKHITSSSSADDKNIGADGIYFVDSDVTDVSHTRFGLKNLIIIGTDVDTQSKLAIKSNGATHQYFNLGKDGGIGLALKNIEMDFSTYTQTYVVNAGSEESNLDYVVFDQCKATFPNTGNKAFNVINLSGKANIHIKNIVFYGNRFSFLPSTGNINLVNITSPAAGTKYSGYESFTCSNNVLYASQSAQGISGFSLLQANLDETKLDAIYSLSVNNNTIVNLYSKNAMMRMRAVNIVSKANLMWNDYDNTDSRSWLFLTKRSDAAVELEQLELTGNTVYDQTANKKNWIVIHENGYRPGNYTDYTLNYLDVNPFDGGTFDITNGVFKVSAAYEGIGASLD